MVEGELNNNLSHISDYILGTDWRRFEMVGIRIVRNYPSDHLLLWARLLLYPTEVGHQ